MNTEDAAWVRYEFKRVSEYVAALERDLRELHGITADDFAAEYIRRADEIPEDELVMEWSVWHSILQDLKDDVAEVDEDERKRKLAEQST